MARVTDGANALPVAWDGVPVEWGPWEAPEPVFICPPPKQQPCPECGLIRPRAVSRGRRQRPHIGRYSPLFAYRCTACGHDQVEDLDAGQTWDLDMTDYGPDGSWSLNGGSEMDRLETAAQERYAALTAPMCHRELASGYYCAECGTYNPGDDD